jgi:hypothetical protein
MKTAPRNRCLGDFVTTSGSFTGSEASHNMRLRRSTSSVWFGHLRVTSPTNAILWGMDKECSARWKKFLVLCQRSRGGRGPRRTRDSCRSSCRASVLAGGLDRDELCQPCHSAAQNRSARLPKLYPLRNSAGKRAPSWKGHISCSANGADGEHAGIAVQNVSSR